MKNRVIIFLMCLGLASPALAAELSGGQLHGFMSQGYLKSSHNNFLAHNTEDGTFEFLEMGINYNKWLRPGLSAGFQLFAKDLGKSGNQEVKLDWANLNYRWQSWLSLKAGRLKMPTGLYNDSRDIDMVRPWVLLPQSCYTEYFRDPSLAVDGASLYGNIPVGPAGALSYEVQYGSQEMNDERDGVMTRYIEDLTTFIPEETDDYEATDRWVVNLEWATPVPGLTIGGSYTEVDLKIDSHYAEDLAYSPSAGVNLTINAGDPIKTEYDYWEQNYYYIKYVWNNLVLSGECMFQEQKADMTTYSSGTSAVTFPNPLFGVVPGEPATMTVTTNGWTDTRQTKTEVEGYYVSAAYRFNDWFQLAGYYSEAYPDANDKDGDDLVAAGNNDFEAWLKDTCITLRFDIGMNWIVKIEEHFMDGAAYHNPVDNDDYNRHWNLTTAKVTYMF